MFGMEKQSQQSPTKKITPFQYELEKEMADPKIRKALGERCEGIAGKIKTLLRSGLEKDDYENGLVLLSGYGSLIKVVSKINKKSK